MCGDIRTACHNASYPNNFRICNKLFGFYSFGRRTLLEAAMVLSDLCGTVRWPSLPEPHGTQIQGKTAQPVSGFQLIA